MFEIVASTKFLRDLKLLKKRSGKDLKALQRLITILSEKVTKDLIKGIKVTGFRAITRVIGSVMLSRIYCLSGMKMNKSIFWN